MNINLNVVGNVNLYPSAAQIASANQNAMVIEEGASGDTTPSLFRKPKSSLRRPQSGVMFRNSIDKKAQLANVDFDPRFLKEPRQADTSTSQSPAARKVNRSRP